MLLIVSYSSLFFCLVLWFHYSNKFTINWNKDRGTNPDGSERLNDLHFTLAEKREARPITIQ